MKYITLAALLGFANINAIKLLGKGQIDIDTGADIDADTLLTEGAELDDNSDPLGKNVAGSETWEDQKLSGFNGADEDEIMDNFFSKFCDEGRTPSGHKTGQKLLMKDKAKLAAGTILEAAHKLKPAEVPGYLDAHFEEAWNHYDQNHEGWIRYEETHTFQKYL